MKKKYLKCVHVCKNAGFKLKENVILIFFFHYFIVFYYTKSKL